MWQFGIIYSTNTPTKTAQDYLNILAVTESRQLNKAQHGHNRVVSLLRKIVSHKA